MGDLDLTPCFLLIGPLGSGKGTQAQLLSQHFGFSHLSTGDLFRAAVRDQTPLGMQVKTLVDSGQYVPDSLTNAVLDQALAALPQKGKAVLLDGYPRTLVQAEALDGLLAAHHLTLARVLHLVLPDDVVMQRLVGRFSCTSCGAVYHDVFKKPTKSDTCDRCGGHDFQRRSDDTPEVVAQRLVVYHRETAPLLAFYRQKGVVLDLDGTQTADAVHQEICHALHLKG